MASLMIDSLVEPAGSHCLSDGRAAQGGIPANSAGRFSRAAVTIRPTSGATLALRSACREQNSPSGRIPKEPGPRVRPVSLPTGKRAANFPPFRPNCRQTVPKSATIGGCSGKIPYAVEQGDYSAHQGSNVPCSADNKDNSRPPNRGNYGIRPQRTGPKASDRTLSSGDAHRPACRRSRAKPVDLEVVPLRLSGDRGLNGFDELDCCPEKTAGARANRSRPRDRGRDRAGQSMSRGRDCSSRRNYA